LRFFETRLGVQCQFFEAKIELSLISYAIYIFSMMLWIYENPRV